MLNFKKSKLLLLVVLAWLVLGFSKTATAKDIVLKDLSGSSVNFSANKGKPAIVFFWTTWCHFCQVEIKILNQGYKNIEQEGITVFVVNVGESEYKVRRFFKNYALNFKVFLDQDGLLADRYNIIGVPTYIFLDKFGQIVSSKNKLPVDYKNLLLK